MKPFNEGPKPPVGDRSFYNGVYQAILDYRDREAGLTILTIRREDRKPVTDWRDVQWIKNQLLGPEVEAVQLFPSESRLVDSANQFYLYALEKGRRFPFGFESRMVSESVSAVVPHGQPSVQRPFADHVRPPDLAESEERLRRMLTAAGVSVKD